MTSKWKLSTDTGYEATVSSTVNSEKIYMGVTGGSWKQRSFKQKAS